MTNPNIRKKWDGLYPYNQSDLSIEYKVSKSSIA